MASFIIYFESLRLSSCPPVSKDLFKIHSLLHTPNKVLEALANVYKKAPNTYNKYADETNMLLLLFLFEEQFPDLNIIIKYLDALLQMTDPLKRSTKWESYVDLFLGTIQYCVISLNPTMSHHISVPGFSQLLEKISENSFIRSEFIFTDQSILSSTDKKFILVRNSLLMLTQFLGTKQLFPICINTEKILVLLENLHSLLFSLMNDNLVAVVEPILKQIYTLVEFVVVYFVDIFEIVTRFLSTMLSSRFSIEIDKGEWLSIRLGQLNLISKLYCHLSIDYSKALTKEFIHEIVVTLTANTDEINFKLLSAQLKIIASLFSTLPPIESWFPLDQVLRLEASLLSHPTKTNELIFCLGELYLNSPTLLSRSGSLFIQLVQTSTLPIELQVKWRLRLREVVHSRRQSNFYIRDILPASTSLNTGNIKSDENAIFSPAANQTEISNSDVCPAEISSFNPELNQGLNNPNTTLYSNLPGENIAVPESNGILKLSNESDMNTNYRRDGIDSILSHDNNVSISPIEITGCYKDTDSSHTLSNLQEQSMNHNNDDRDDEYSLITELN